MADVCEKTGSIKVILLYATLGAIGQERTIDRPCTTAVGNTRAADESDRRWIDADVYAQTRNSRDPQAAAFLPAIFLSCLSASPKKPNFVASLGAHRQREKKFVRRCPPGAKAVLDFLLNAKHGFASARLHGQRRTGQHRTLVTLTALFAGSMGRFTGDPATLAPVGTGRIDPAPGLAGAFDGFVPGWQAKFLPRLRSVGWTERAASFDTSLEQGAGPLCRLLQGRRLPHATRCLRLIPSLCTPRSSEAGTRVAIDPLQALSNRHADRRGAKNYAAATIDMPVARWANRLDTVYHKCVRLSSIKTKLFLRG